MYRKLDYNITTEYEGMRIETYLKKHGYSSQNITEIKRMPKSVLRNGIHEYMNQPLHEGDLLEIVINETEYSEKIPPVDIPLDIVYEDEDIIVINKPADMPIHPSLNNYYNSMANALAYYYKQQDKPFIFRCTNRLDRDTSGLTVVAKHLLSGNILSTMTPKKLINRQYYAICRGEVEPSEGVIEAPLARAGTSLIERKVDFENGDRAVTHYRVVDHKNGHSLVELKLDTGRTHQIRVHMKYLGYPLVGDYLYNPDMEYITRQALHSHRLSFPHPITGELMVFESPLPQDMQNILDGKRIE